MDELVDFYHELDSIRRLWVAVLIQAVIDYFRRYQHINRFTDRESHDYWSKQARRWFVSRDRGIGTYLWICGMLGISPRRLQIKIFATTQIHVRTLKAALSAIREAEGTERNH